MKTFFITLLALTTAGAGTAAYVFYRRNNEARTQWGLWEQATKACESKLKNAHASSDIGGSELDVGNVRIAGVDVGDQIGPRRERLNG